MIVELDAKQYPIYLASGFIQARLRKIQGLFKDF